LIGATASVNSSVTVATARVTFGMLEQEQAAQCGDVCSPNPERIMDGMKADEREERLSVVGTILDKSQGRVHDNPRIVAANALVFRNVPAVVVIVLRCIDLAEVRIKRDAIQSCCHFLRRSSAPDHGASHGPPRKMIDHVQDPPAYGPSLPDCIGKPVRPKAAANRHRR